LQWAGKTTASCTILPELLRCKEFVNADEMARGISPFNADSVPIEAGRMSINSISPLEVAAEGGKPAKQANECVFV
jgi:predicted ABC-type ATPase